MRLWRSLRWVRVQCSHLVIPGCITSTSTDENFPRSTKTSKQQKISHAGLSCKLDHVQRDARLNSVECGGPPPHSYRIGTVARPSGRAPLRLVQPFPTV